MTHQSRLVPRLFIMTLTTILLCLQARAAVCCTATGSGLKGDYYNGRNLDSFVFTRIDAFGSYLNWGEGSPGPGLSGDNCSARWIGEIEAPVTGIYSFRTDSDDGARLWVNNANQIDSWCECVNNKDVDGTSSQIFLEAGKRYPIRLEWFEAGGNALIALFWYRPDTGLCEYVPTRFLYPCSSPQLVITPSSLSVPVRGTAAFTVTSPNVAELSCIQWQFRGADIPGATNSTLVLDRVSRRQSGLYRVWASIPEGCCSLSQEVLLSVRPRVRSGRPNANGFTMSVEAEPDDVIEVMSTERLLSDVSLWKSTGITVTNHQEVIEIEIPASPGANHQFFAPIVRNAE